MGNEEKFGFPGYQHDETEGLIPRSIKYLWARMAQSQDKYFVKASFLEIYNEQINDLLNVKKTNLNCRWTNESVSLEGILRRGPTGAPVRHCRRHVTDRQ